MPTLPIYDYLPDPQTILELMPDELGKLLLELMNQDSGYLNRYNLVNPHVFSEYPREYQDRVTDAVGEAWEWFEREGLIMPDRRQGHNWVTLTRRGQELATTASLSAYRNASLLPKGLLHPTIAGKVYSAFLRGEYDTAVFQAFREVEVAVRTKGGFAPTDTGTDLMRKAFHETTGSLTDMTDPVSERQALSHLFAGAIGYFRNPIGHRNVTIVAEEAVEMIMFAGHLLRIVDARP